MGKFLLMASREKSGSFSFDGVSLLSAVTRFKNLMYEAQKEEKEHDCLVAEFTSGRIYLSLQSEDCEAEHTVICQKVFVPRLNCDQKLYNESHTFFQWMLDPDLKHTRNVAIMQKKAYLKDMAYRLNQTLAFKAAFSTLWYAPNSCFDILGITTSSVLKYCEWKGLTIPCASVFTTIPTDVGMCCSFNMNAAEEIFQDTLYTQKLQAMQTADKNLTRVSSQPIKYRQNKEPKSMPGRNRGLSVLLDLHSNDLAIGSLKMDFQGFMGLGQYVKK